MGSTTFSVGETQVLEPIDQRNSDICEAPCEAGATCCTGGETVKAAFQADPAVSPVRILLATDAASEGIDLQNHCNLLVHVEIPYNPNVMEQRNGRVDRHGQKQSEVVIWHPVDASGGHGDDILRALKKLDSMRADMGSVNPVIAPQLPALLEGRRRELDTGLAEKRIERARRYVKASGGCSAPAGKDMEEALTRLGRMKFRLDDAPVASGCVELIPGSHRGGLATPAGGVIPPALVDAARAVPVPAVAGEVLLLDPLVWHRSGRNHTAAPRRALTLVLMPASTRCTRTRKAPRQFVRLYNSAG